MMKKMLPRISKFRYHILYKLIARVQTFVSGRDIDLVGPDNSMKVMLCLLILSIVKIVLGFLVNEHIGNIDSLEKQKILQDLKQQLDESINVAYANNDMGHAKSVLERTATNKTDVHLNDKRSEVYNARWLCNTTYNWKVLGDSFYPRFLKETVCSQTTCVRGHYSCQPYYNPVYILCKREVSDPLDIKIPRTLRNEWKFTTVNLAVGCQCGSVL